MRSSREVAELAAGLAKPEGALTKYLAASVSSLRGRTNAACTAIVCAQESAQAQNNPPLLHTDVLPWACANSEDVSTQWLAQPLILCRNGLVRRSRRSAL